MLRMNLDFDLGFFNIIQSVAQKVVRAVRNFETAFAVIDSASTHNFQGRRKPKGERTVQTLQCFRFCPSTLCDHVAFCMDGDMNAIYLKFNTSNQASFFDK